MNKGGDDLRKQARRLYVDSDLVVDEIAKQIGRTTRTIQSWASIEGWPRRTGPSPAPHDAAASQHTTPAASARPRRRTKTAETRLSLHQRCCRLFDQFLSSLEDRMSTDDPNAEPLSERDVRALNGFSRAIEKIKEIEPGHDPAERAAHRHGNTTSTRDEEDRLRRELVDRLLKLRERKRAEDAARGSDGDA